MSEHREGHSAAYERIRSKKTLGEILEVATSFEKAAFDFYTALIPKVSKNLRYLVEELAAEEQTHYELFTKLAKNPDIESQVQSEIKTPAEDRRFSLTLCICRILVTARMTRRYCNTPWGGKTRR